MYIYIYIHITHSYVTLHYIHTNVTLNYLPLSLKQSEYANSAIVVIAQRPRATSTQVRLGTIGSQHQYLLVFATTEVHTQQLQSFRKKPMSFQIQKPVRCSVIESTNQHGQHIERLVVGCSTTLTTRYFSTSTYAYEYLCISVPLPTSSVVRGCCGLASVHCPLPSPTYAQKIEAGQLGNDVQVNSEPIQVGNKYDATVPTDNGKYDFWIRTQLKVSTYLRTYSFARGTQVSSKINTYTIPTYSTISLHVGSYLGTQVVGTYYIVMYGYGLIVVSSVFTFTDDLGCSLMTTPRPSSVYNTKKKKKEVGKATKCKLKHLPLPLPVIVSNSKRSRLRVRTTLRTCTYYEQRTTQLAQCGMDR